VRLKFYMFEVWICFFYGGLVGFEIYVLRIGFFVCDFRQVLKKVAFLGKKWEMITLSLVIRKIQNN
jgi:hypothetical protein